MKTRFYSRRATRLALALAVAAVAPSATKSTIDAPVLVSHSRIQPHRDTDGTLKRGPLNEIQTSNWSGYAVSNSETGNSYPQAQATWTVNKVSYVTPPPTCHVFRFGKHSYKICSSSHPQWEYSSSWVGIGGYCESSSCTTVDNTLIQLGTEHDASVVGTTEYYAWIEMLPNAPIIISSSNPNNCTSLSCANTVQPGDVITASLQCTSNNCTLPDGSPQTWQLQMVNENPVHGWTFQTTVTYNSTLLSAEWIQEAPSSSAGVLPLANFGTANFDPSINSGAALVLDASANSIQLVDPYGETSNPSGPGPAEAFNACWGNNAPNFTTCTAP
ncbi:MAG TPA: G1 family glutamic endopeptidase [Stellaceae bacterium]|nr:G1 family glutamic endopeptidase [Stellaceae bacterium]